MDLGLRDHVAFIAAGSKGLGRAVAEELASEGVHVGICARGKSAIDDACDAMRRRGVRAHGVVADVSNPDEVVRAVSAVRTALGPIDILVTNSGGPRAGGFAAVGPADWDDAVRLMLASATGLIRAVLPDMRGRAWGRILNITSIAAKQPIDGLILSNSVRAAVTAMGRTLASEVAAEGITVNNLMPGYTRTERVVELSEQMARAGGTDADAVVARWEAEIPMRRIGEPREFAALAAFLASDRAGYITGQTIAVDGGWIRSML